MDPEPFRAIPKGIFILHAGFRVHEEWTLNPLGPYLLYFTALPNLMACHLFHPANNAQALTV